MKFNPTYQTILASALALVLAGCSSVFDGDSGGGTAPTTPQGGSGQDATLTLSDGLAASSAQPVHAVSGLAGLLASLLPGGNNAFPAVSSAIERNYQDDTVSTHSGSSIKSISSDGSGGFLLTALLAGEEGEADKEMMINFPAGSFTDEGDWERFYVEFDETEFDLDHRARFAYFDLMELHGNDDTNVRIIFAFGARTPADGLPQGTATYYGTLFAQAFSADDPNEQRITYDSDLTLEADFSDSSISGTANRLQSERRGEDGSNMSADNRIDITNGKIVNGQFVADWTGQGPEGGPTETVRGMEGQLLGEFYGPGAEEVGGVVNGRRAATSSHPAQVIYGDFDGSRDDGTFALNGPTLSAHGPQITRYRDLRDLKTRITDPPGEARVTSIEQNSSGGYRVTYVVDGSERVIDFEGPIAPARSGKEVTVDGIEYDIRAWRGAFSGQHVQTLSAGVNPCAVVDDYCGSSAWLNFGQETAPERLQSLGSASYAGDFYATVAPPQGGLSRNWRNLYGDLALDADFASGGLSGLIDGLSMQPSSRESGSEDPPWADLPDSNSIVISNGRITDSRFWADWAGQDTDAAADPDRSMRGFTGDMAGAFYGPDGEEVGGVVGGGRGQEWLVQGAFAGTATTGN